MTTKDRKTLSVFIIESNNPADFYDRQLDGVAVQGLLKILRIKTRLRIALDLKQFNRALREAKKREFDVVHLSCHGDADGIALAIDGDITWDKLAELFQKSNFVPSALIMSSCYGGAKGIGKAFATKPKRPEIIFGSKDKREYSEYVTAWSLLYHQFQSKGVSKSCAQTALKQINATVSHTFIYRRWDPGKKKYLSYPKQGARYEIREVSD